MGAMLNSMLFQPPPFDASEASSVSVVPTQRVRNAFGESLALWHLDLGYELQAALAGIPRLRSTHHLLLL